MNKLKCLQLISFIFLVNSAFSAVIPNKTDTGLYTPEDNVVILTADNFNQTIFYSNKPWIVEFYSSWCGFCQRFAPHWKEFAAEVKNWQDIFGLGVVDCANELNNPVCFEMVVISYPTLRYFYQNYEQKPGNVGKRLPLGQNVADHKKHLIDTLIEDQSQGISKIEPNLLPYKKDNISDLFEMTPSTTLYGVLIIQNPDDTIGAEVSLDLHRLRESVVIRYAFNNNSQLMNFLGPNQTPSMYVIDRAYSLIHLNSFTLDREGFGRTVLQFLASKNIQVPSDLIIPTMTTENKTSSSADPNKIVEEIKKMGDVVLQGDLETALRYSLRNEVGLRKEITGEKLQALRKHVAVLVKYFPFGNKGKSLLSKIKNYVDTTDTVNGAEISKMMKQAEKPTENIFSSPRQWLACQGSLPHSRGYPCGLWKLFHYLTVNAAIEKSEQNPKEILETMKEYIGNFFGCEDCKRHFLDMTERREMSKVSSLDEAVLWLWKAHNEVNKRLAGDETEDPAYPKVQFPLKERCAQCYNSDNTWNEPEVLLYLKKVYARENIQYLGSSREVLKLETMNLASRTSRTIFSMSSIFIPLGITLYINFHKFTE